MMILCHHEEGWTAEYFRKLSSLKCSLRWGSCETEILRYSLKLQKLENDDVSGPFKVINLLIKHL